MHIGIHVNANNLQLINKYNMTACQIFTVIPQKLQLVNYNKEELKKHSEKINIWIHSSYLVSPWGTKPYNYPFCLKQLTQQVEIGAQGIIFHIPKLQPSELVDGLKKLIKNKPKGSRIILENKAVKPDDLLTYETPDKINNLIKCFIDNGIPKKDIWICIDTAHLHSSKINLSTYKDANDWLNGLKYPERIALFHLNGSSSKTYSDKHIAACSKKDLIWGNIPFGISGVKAIKEFCNKYKIDIILECDFDNEKDDVLDLIKKLKK